MKFLARCFTHILFALALSLFSASIASAAVRTWDGGGSTNNWSEDANWSDNTEPGTGDVATFDATSTKAATIDITISVGGVDINTGYSGTITQSAALTVGGSNYDQADGIFTGGSASVTFNGTFTLTGGTFTQTTGTTTYAGSFAHNTGGTFTHNSGTSKFTVFSGTINISAASAGTETFGTFTLEIDHNNCLSVASGDTIIIAGDMTIVNGNLCTGTVEIKGNITWGAASDGAGTDTNLRITGTGDQTITSTSGASFRGTHTIDKVSGNVYLGSNYSLTSGAFVLTNGTFYARNSANTNNYSLTSIGSYSQSGGTFNGGSSTISQGGYTTFTLSGGTYSQSSGTTTYGGSGWTHTAGGTFTHNSGTSSFINGNGTFNVDNTTGETFYHLTLSASGDNNDNKTITSGDKLIAEGNVTIDQGSFDTGTLEVRGNLTLGSGADDSSALFKINGTGDQTITKSGGTLSGGVTVDKASGSVYLGANFSLSSAFILTSGTMYLRDSGAVTNYSITLTSTYSQGGGTMNTGSSAFSVSGAFSQTSGTFNGGSSTVGHTGTFSLSGGTYSQSTGTTTYGSTFTHTAGGTFTHNSGTSLFSGSSSSIDVGTTETFGHLTISLTGGQTKTVANSTTLIVSGTLTLTDGSVSQTTIPTAGTISAQGNVVGASTYDGGTGKLIFSGSATQTFDLTGAAGVYNGDIAVNKAGGAVNLLTALTMDASGQDLVIEEGTFDVSGFTLSVTGAGTETIIVETGGNLQLQGGETITGDSASYPQLNSGSTVTYDGTSTPYTLKDYTYHHLTIAGGASSVFTLAANESLGGNLTLTTGILSQGGFTLAVTGTFSNDSTLRRFQNETLTVTMDINSGTIEYVGDGDGSAETVTLADLGTTDYYNLKINDTNVTKDIFALGAATVIAGTLQVTSSEFQQGLYDLTAVTLLVDGGTLTGSSSSSFVITVSGNATISSGTANIGAAAIDVFGTLTISGGTYNGNTSWGQIINLALSSGAYNGNTSTPTLIFVTISGGTFTASSATTTVGGDWTHTAGGTFVHNSGTVAFTGGGANINVTETETFSGLTISKDDNTLTIASGDTLVAEGTLTLSNGYWQTGTLVAQGNIVVGASWDAAGASTLNVTGSATQTLDLSAGAGLLDNPVTVNKAGGSLTLASAYTLDHANADFTLTLGTFSTGNFTMTTSSGSDIAVNGGTFNAGSSTMTLAGLMTVAGGTYNGNTSSGTTSGAFLLSSGAYNGNTSTPTFSGGLTISGGVFTASSGTMTVSANFAHTAGTFTHNSGTVAFNNSGVTSTISGDSTFYNFTSTTANKPITFTAGTTQTVSGLLTLTGTSGNLIVLRSTVTDSVWNLNVSGTSSVDYVNVRDSNAAGGNAITHAVAASRSVNVANNTNWSFNAAPTVATVTAVQSSAGDGDITITFIMDDPDDDNTLQGKVEYSLNGGSSWADPTISTTGSETSATFGDPSVSNAATYQVGQSGAYILSSSGANTVTIVWESATDIASSTDISNARIRITPYDGVAEGTASSSSNFTLDRVGPSGLANFRHTDFSNSQVVLSWTASTDTNFNHYEIWSGVTESQVIARSGSAVEWDNDNDATLTTASTARTTINNTDPRNKFFKIFAVDNYGNELTLATYYLSGGTTSSSSSSSSGGGGGGGGSSSSSNDDEEEEEEEEIVEEEEEEVTDEEETEEEEEEEVNIWEEFDVQVDEDQWSNGYVKYLAEETNIIEVAVSQPTFLDILTSILSTPNEAMPRGNALEFLLVLAGYSLDTMTVNVRSIAFEDVSLADDQAGFIQFAYEQRLIQGYPDGTFQTDRIVNRAEALKLCSYFFEGDWTHELYGDDLLALYDLTENPFTDVDLNAWYAPYLINAYAKGVVSGYGDGTFGPGNEVTYAEFLKIATLMQNIEEAVEMAEELQ